MKTRSRPTGTNTKSKSSAVNTKSKSTAKNAKSKSTARNAKSRSAAVNKKSKSKSKNILEIDDSEMDEILTEFAAEEKKNVVKIDDNDEEFDSLVEEFANAESDSDKEKSSAKVILLSSDNEIDDLLEDFE